ncbi:MAG: CgeB family protein [Janthinobacterium lividum]
MKILYVSQLEDYDSAWYRVLALRREGHVVTTINTSDYGQSNRMLRKLEFRAAAGPEVNRLNRDLLTATESVRPDVVWADKVLWMRPDTLTTLRDLRVVTVSYMIDNFFGPRRDPGWRLYARTIPHYDLHCTQRNRNLYQYLEIGARDALKIQTAYEPTVHFPPPMGWSDVDRDRDVSFVGTPYDERADFLTRLWRQCGFAVQVNGGLVWKRALGEEATAAIYRGNGELRNQAYREAIWRSRINLSFLTHSNQDEFTHKSFEIAACGGFLLAERSAGHSERFTEDKEAVFFSDFDECAAKIKRYLHDVEGRERIARNGQWRAAMSGYDNDTQVRKIVERLQPLIDDFRSQRRAAQQAVRG